VAFKALPPTLEATFFFTMLLEEIKGFYRGKTKIFLLVGSYTMLSWQLIKEVLIAVHQHLYLTAQFNLFGFL